MFRIASSSHLLQVIAVSAACGLLAVAAAATQPKTASEQLPVPVLEGFTDELVSVPVAARVRQAAPPPAPSNQLLFVFGAGDGTYVMLGGAEDAPAHGTRRMVQDEGIVATVADVDPAKLPAKFRGWVGKELVVDGACRAHVTGFAVVTRLIGDPGYAGLEDTEWNVATAAAAGTTVFAARIDDCRDGTYAREAALAPIVALEQIEDANANILETARSAFLASDAAHDAEVAWLEERQHEAEGGVATAGTGSWIDHVSVTSRVVRHPKTGVTWVAIHAGGDRSCGGADINVWGLFRVATDGAIETVHVRKLESLYSVERIIDVDGDGTPELIGNDWLGMVRLLTRADGTEMSRLAMQFHGCPC